MVSSALTTSKTPAIIVTEIMMMTSTFKGAHFLVEGDDDSKFWKIRIAKGSTSIVNCEGKVNLLGASKMIAHLGLPSVAGVYDADFDHLFGVIHAPNVLTPTDENDLEVTLLASEALDTLLHEYADDALLNAFKKEHGLSATEHLEAMSREFGKLRLISRQLLHHVDFDQLSPYRFISQDAWTLDVTALHVEYAKLAGISVAQLHSDLAATIPHADLWGLCQGHDSVRILAQGLKRKLGKKQICEQDLAKILRIAYSLEMLQQSRMYKALRSLEAKLQIPIFD